MIAEQGDQADGKHERGEEEKEHMELAHTLPRPCLHAAMMAGKEREKNMAISIHNDHNKTRRKQQHV